MAAVLLAAAPGGSAAAPAGSGDLPATPDLPRLRQLWTAPWLPPARHERDAEPAQAGIYLGWKTEERASFSGRRNTLAALDVRTGKEVWRHPGLPEELASESPAIFAGDLALFRQSSTTFALSLATGRKQWTSAACGFRNHLLVAAGAGRQIGAGVCRDIVWVPPLTDPRATSHIGHHRIEAVDLGTGKVLWESPAGPGNPVLGAGPAAFFLAAPAGKGQAPGMRLLELDPASGSVRREIHLREEHAFWIHAPPHRPDQVVVIGHELTALDPATGRILWSRERPMWWSDDRKRPPAALDDRLYLSYRDSVYEFNLRTGGKRKTHVLPGGLGAYEYAMPRLMPLPQGGLLVAMDQADGPAAVVHFARSGAVPDLAVLPAGRSGVLTAQEGAIVVLGKHKGGEKLEGYSLFETLPSEAVSLDAPARVRAQLERDPWTRGLRPAERRRRERDLRAVPGVEGILAAFARDTSLPWQKDALLAALALEVPERAGLLRAEALRPLSIPDTSILRPPPEPPRPPGPRIPAPPRSRSRFLNVMPTIPPHEARALDIRFKVGESLGHRAFVLSSLAALDDTASAGILAPILLARRTTAGLRREDWELWGAGPKSWPAARNAGGGFSGCLQGPSGRPGIHADVYRMLARLGRASDRAVLARFDSVTAPAGWAGLCAADDALPKPYVDPGRLPYGTGMCLGRDLGAYRLAQVGAIWARRRGRDGRLGPPAWAHDPGGDLVLDVRPLLAARIDGRGALKLRGWELRDMEDSLPWRAAVDPARVFADRDGDGITDATEGILGTRPDRADTDGDGSPDGRDPAPLSGPARTEAGRAADEALRYLTAFRFGGPVSVYAEREYWSGGGGSEGAGVVLHRTPPARRLPGCPAYDFCADGRTAEERERSRFRCETILAIESIRIRGADAEAEIAWADEHGRRRVFRLDMRQVGGVWRVTGEGQPQG